VCKIYDSNGKLHSISKNLGALYNELNPSIFFKANRSQIIHINAIESIASHSKNRLYLKINNRKDLVVTSTSVTKNFRVLIIRHTSNVFFN